jgi:hypothetical protein
MLIIATQTMTYVSEGILESDPKMLRSLQYWLSLHIGFESRSISLVVTKEIRQGAVFLFVVCFPSAPAGPFTSKTQHLASRSCRPRSRWLTLQRQPAVHLKHRLPYELCYNSYLAEFNGRDLRLWNCGVLPASQQLGIRFSSAAPRSACCMSFLPATGQQCYSWCMIYLQSLSGSQMFYMQSCS